MKKKILALFTILAVPAFLCFTLSFPVSADCGDVETALIDCPTASGGTPRYLAIDIINILSVGIGIVGVIGISIFGIQMLTSRDDPARVATARKRFFQIFIGLAIYLFMWTGVNWLLPGGVIFGRIATESITIGPSVANVAVNETSKLIAAIYPLDADDQTVQWEVSDPSIATIDDFGNVTGVSIGEVTVTATTSNGLVAQSTVNIVANASLPAYCTSSGGSDGSSSSSNDGSNTTTVDSGTSDGSTPYVDGLEIHFVSTGHDDDAILIRSADKVIVIDGGRCDSSQNGGSNSSCTPGMKFVNYMKTAGVTKIDALIGSHTHWNHIQAHSVIVKNFPTANAYYPNDLNNCIKSKKCDSADIKYVASTLKEKNITPQWLKIWENPQILVVGDMRLFFVGPLKEGKHNKGSFVFILQYGDKRFMFSGDQEWDGLSETKNGKNSPLEGLKAKASALGTDLKVDLFKWPHHGYKDSQLTNSDEKKFFDEIKSSYVVVPNSNSCGGDQVTYAVKNLGQKKYSNCGKTNLVITSDGKTITFHENQSPKDWAPKKTVDEAGQTVTPTSPSASTSQACIPPIDSTGGTHVATTIGDATFVDGNGCDDSTIFPGTKYNLTESQVKLVADRVRHENCGSLKACKAEASQIVNLYEKKKPNESHTTENFWKWFKTTGWYATSFSGLRESGATAKGIEAVKSVVVNGNRTLPAKVAGHDTWEFNASKQFKYNIIGFYDSNGTAQYFKVHSAKTDTANIKKKVDQMIPGTTKLIRRVSGGTDTKTFWCVIRYGNDRFGDSFALGT